MIQNYGFTPARVSVGIDDFDAHAYDPVEFAAWAASMGYSTAHWAFDPARPTRHPKGTATSVVVSHLLKT